MNSVRARQGRLSELRRGAVGGHQVTAPSAGLGPAPRVDAVEDAHEVAEHDVFVNAMAPVAIVLTQGADYVRDIARKNPDMVEPVELMTEAALELCTERHVGRVVYSRDLLHSVGRPVRSWCSTTSTA